MNHHSALLLLFFITILLGTNAQWFIIKKTYPSNLMNYPNPGKRSIPEEDFKLLNTDCSVPYSYLKTYEERTVWLLSCNYKNSPLMMINDLTSSNSNSIEDERYPISDFISREQRTPRSIPPYFNEHPELFHRRVLKRLRRAMKK